MFDEDSVYFPLIGDGVDPEFSGVAGWPDHGSLTAVLTLFGGPPKGVSFRKLGASAPRIRVRRRGTGEPDGLGGRIGDDDISEASKVFGEPDGACFAGAVGSAVQVADVSGKGSAAVENGRDSVVGYQNPPGEGITNSFFGLSASVVIEVGKFREDVVVAPDGIVAELVNEGEPLSPAVRSWPEADGRWRSGMENAVTRAVTVLVAGGDEWFDLDALALDRLDGRFGELGAEGRSVGLYQLAGERSVVGQCSAITM